MAPKPTPKVKTDPNDKQEQARNLKKNPLKPSSKDAQGATKEAPSPMAATPKPAAPKPTPRSREASPRTHANNKPKSVPKFPLEHLGRPTDMEPGDITRIYHLPKGELKCEDDVVESVGYRMQEKLDEGGFGVIFFAWHKKKEVRVACKRCDLGFSDTDPRMEDMKNELFIMEKVKHLYVVKLYTHFITVNTKGKGENRLWIFMQLADSGNFAKFCEKKGAMKEEECKGYMAQILCGLNHMHSLGIAHRDIKLQNILLLKAPGTSITGDYTLLVCDFGLSRVLRHGRDGYVELQRTVCGTPLFMSPELLLHKPYQAFAVDMWALGITIFIMLTMQVPFDFRNETAAVKAMIQRTWVWPEKDMRDPPSEDLRRLMKNALEPDTRKRITMAQMCRHRWMGNWFRRAQAAANRVRQPPASKPKT